MAMNKGLKITIGILTLGVTGFGIYMLYKKVKNKSKEGQWDDSIENDTDDSQGTNSSSSNTPAKSPEQSKAENFNAVKKYFGSSGATYNNRLIVRKSASQIAQLTGKSVNSLGITSKGVAVIYWDDGQFTVRINDVLAALSGYYYKGGTVIKVSKGKGKFASKKGLVERVGKGYNPLIAIGKAIVR